MIKFKRTRIEIVLNSKNVEDMEKKKFYGRRDIYFSLFHNCFLCLLKLILATSGIPSNLSYPSCISRNPRIEIDFAILQNTVSQF